ncbi:hypothetical protein D3C77_679560 [compost metagenome]
MRNDMAQAQAQAAAEGAHGLHHAGVVADGATGATVLFTHVRQDQAKLAGLEPGGAVGTVLLAPVQFVGLHVLLGKTLDHVAKLLQVFGHPG